MVATSEDAGVGSLRQGVDCLPINGVMTFDPSMSGQSITLTSGPLDITRNLSILQTPSNSINIIGAENNPVFNVGRDIQFTLRNINICPANGNFARAIYNEGVLALDNTLILEPSVNLGNGSSIQNFNIINFLGTSGIIRF